MSDAAIKRALAKLAAKLGGGPFKAVNHNDVGPNDEGFWEWWTVEGPSSPWGAGPKFDDEEAAQLLAGMLNAAVERAAGGGK